jgi:hypothetical protein
MLGIWKINVYWNKKYWTVVEVLSIILLKLGIQFTNPRKLFNRIEVGSLLRFSREIFDKVLLKSIVITFDLPNG